MKLNKFVVELIKPISARITVKLHLLDYFLWTLHFFKRGERWHSSVPPPLFYRRRRRRRRRHRHCHRHFLSAIPLFCMLISIHPLHTLVHAEDYAIKFWWWYPKEPCFLYALFKFSSNALITLYSICRHVAMSIPHTKGIKMVRSHSERQEIQGIWSWKNYYFSSMQASNERHHMYRTHKHVRTHSYAYT